MDFLITHFNYIVVIILMMIGLYVVFAANNLIKKLVGLSVFQTSVFLLYITLAKVEGGVPPILKEYKAKKKEGYGDSSGGYDGAYDSGAQAAETLFSNPLPHVLILTAIVVGVATLAVGLALVVRIREVYGTIEETEIDKINYAYNLEGADDISAKGEATS